MRGQVVVRWVVSVRGRSVLVDDCVEKAKQCLLFSG